MCCADVHNETGYTVLMWAVDKGLFSVVERLVTAGVKAKMTNTGRMTALALACVKIRDVSVLFGARVSGADTSANISESVGCWVRATVTLSLFRVNTRVEMIKIEVLADSLDKVLFMQEEPLKYEASIDVDFRDFDGTLKTQGKISVLSPDHVIVSESGQM